MLNKFNAEEEPEIARNIDDGMSPQKFDEYLMNPESRKEDHDKLTSQIQTSQ